MQIKKFGSSLLVKALSIFVIVVVTVSGSLLSMLPAEKPPKPNAITPSEDSRVVCSGFPKQSTVYASSSGNISEAKLGWKYSPSKNPLIEEYKDSPIILKSEKFITGGVFTRKGTNLGWTSCLSPKASSVIQVIDPMHTDITLINFTDMGATVDMSFFGSNGEINIAGTKEIYVRARDQRFISIPVLAKIDGPVGVAFNVPSGRIAVQANSWNPTGGDTIRAVGLQEKHILSGIAAKAISTKVLLTNPGGSDAVVNIKAYGRTAIYVPSGGENITVGAKTTKEIDLTSGLSGDSATLTVDSDKPIMAGAFTTLGKDYAVALDTKPAKSLGGVVPTAGILHLSNINKEETDAVIKLLKDGKEIIPAKTQHLKGRMTWDMPIAGDGKTPIYVLVSSKVPILASVTLEKDTGLAIEGMTPNIIENDDTYSFKYDLKLR